MPIVLQSPYNGQPVKLRDQDIGRAVKDNEGRIFYAVPLSDGSGYYAAMTRHGSEKDEQRYLDMLSKGGQAKASGQEQHEVQVHDATGKRKSSGGLLKFIILLIILAAAAGAVYVFVLGGDPSNLPQVPGSEPAQEAPAESPSSRSPALPPLEMEHVELAEAPVEAQAPEPVAAEPTEPVVAAAPPPPPDVGKPAMTELPSGLRYETLVASLDGRAAHAGDYVVVHYQAERATGEALDATRKGEPIGFVLWSGQSPFVGFDHALAGMKPGEVRRCEIPRALVDGLNDLHADLTLVDVKPGVTATTLAPGQGATARPGLDVELHFDVKLVEGDVPVQSTADLGGPLKLRLGAGDLIPGMELGVIGMKEGEQRSLTIPSYLAYGPRGAAGGVIPPGATLACRVHLLRVVQ